MLTRLKATLLLFLLLAGTVACTTPAYELYRPHHLSQNHEREYCGDAQLSDEAFENTIQVFSYYGVRFRKEKNNQIFVHQEDLKDWEFIWNCTLKANDKNWLATHIPKN